mmetsp:Transcript_5720/g.9396  ORF Transcript_5720/g.9396 Transcript_5720/m.9396 type:complete len:144 (+) Transcript_5720:96-527(+)
MIMNEEINVEHLIDNLTVLQRRHCDLEVQLKSLEAVIEQTKDGITNKLEEEKQLDNQRLTLETDIIRLRADNTSLQSEIKHIETTRTRMQFTLDAMSKKREEICMQLEQLNHADKEFLTETEKAYDVGNKTCQDLLIPQRKLD